MKSIISTICLLALAVAGFAQASPAFIAGPYLQAGTTPCGSCLTLCWQSRDTASEWHIETGNGLQREGRRIIPALKTIWRPADMEVTAFYTAEIAGLTPGASFEYKIFCRGIKLFESTGKAPKSADQAFSFVAMGDIGCATSAARSIAVQVAKNDPDLVVVPGDIVYERGLMSEYLHSFWPVYNAPIQTDSSAPLMQRIPFMAAPGNHDTEEKNLAQSPGALAYFRYWVQPLNGPGTNESTAAYPLLPGTVAQTAEFREAAGSRFPGMTNFSYDYGNAHFLFLDANNYVDWTNDTLRDWVSRDLQQAAKAIWKFVIFHQPGFNSAREHYEQQQMRLLAPLFEKGQVDLVISGHVHNYQRTFPLRFLPDNNGVQLIGGKSRNQLKGKIVNGEWILDKKFTETGAPATGSIIYIITGAGGKELYNPEQEKDPDSWQKFTKVFKSNQYSFSRISISGKTLKFIQYSASGQVLDNFSIQK